MNYLTALFRKLVSKPAHAGFMLICALTTLAPVSHADDIDIYAVNRSQNLLMLFDTSLSMSRLEYFDPRGAYNPDFIYPKSNNGFDPDSIYIGTADLLGLVSLSDGGSDTQINVNKLKRIDKTANHCAAINTALFGDPANGIRGSGVYKAEYALDGGFLGNVLGNIAELLQIPPQGAIKLWEQGTGWYGTSQILNIINLGFYTSETVSGVDLDFFGLFGEDPLPTALINCRGDRSHNYMQRNRSCLFGICNGSNGQVNPYTTNSSHETSWSLGAQFYTSAWSGNYLNYQIAKRQFLFLNLGYSSSRLGIARAAMINALEELKNDSSNGLAGLNMGLMRFDIEQLDRANTDIGNAEGGFVDFPMTNLFNASAATPAAQYANYQYMKNKVLRYHPAGATPLSETMLEAHNYLTGGNVVYGGSSNVYWLGEEEPINTWLGGQPNNYNLQDFLSRLFGENSGHEIASRSVRTTGAYTQTLSTPSPGNVNRGHDRYFTGETYYSTGQAYVPPTYGSCPTTQFVIFTDGSPTQDISANGAIRSLINGTQFPAGMAADCGGNGNGECAEELAYYMANTDLDGDPYNDQDMHINTHVVAGFLNNGWLSESPASARARLQKIASAGNGRFHEANNYDELKGVFTDIFKGFTGTTSTFSSPGLTLSSANRLRLSDQLYFPLFDPGENQNWRGNLKRYQLSPEGTVIDADGNEATDTDGRLLENSRSFWSESDDGASVTAGGLSSRLNMGNRKIFTSEATLSSSSTASNLIAINVPTSNGGLLPTITSQLLSTLTDTLLGLTDTSINKSALIAWIGGVKADGTPRLELEDPLHSAPVMLRYKDSSDNETRAIFMGTNSGYLHAFNPDIDPAHNAGEAEFFSFIPRELLKNPAAYYQGSSFFSNKRYGMDGPISYFHEDTNRDGYINNGERAILYAGMRRGGQTIYALDVSNLAAPRLLWQKNGDYSKLKWTEPYGTGTRQILNLPSQVDLPLLGQSWSAAKPAEVLWQGQRRFVLFMGGGYDPINDPDAVANPNNAVVGNTIYMIDAFTGALLWDAHANANLSGSEDQQMDAAFAADVIPIDRDSNALTDLLYATDVSGRVWRFDLSQSHSFSASAGSFAQGGVIADVNQSSSGGSDDRRFYNRPDVSIIRDGAGESVIIGVGSGWRANPRYMDTSNPDYYFIIKDTLARSTPDISNGQQYPRHLFDELETWGTGATSSEGWKVALRDGEKVLSASTTYKGLMFFTTYKPNGSGTSCSADLGQGSLYVLNVYSPDEMASKVPDCCGEGIPSEPSAPMFPNAGGLVLDPTGAGSGTDDSPADCSSSIATVMVGTKAVRGNFNQCSALRKTYWKEL